MTRWLVRLAGPALAAAVVWGVVVWGQGRQVNVAYLAAVAVVSAMLLWLVVDLVPAVPYRSWAVTGTYLPRQSGADIRLTRLSERLGSSVHRDTVAGDIHEILTAVVDDRLRRTYGVDRAADPEAAAAVLGPELAAYLDADTRAGRLGSNRQLARVVARIEEL